MAASIQSLLIGCSGRTLLVRFADEGGAPTNLSAFHGSDIQHVTVRAAGGTFGLSFDGQATPPLGYGIGPDALQSALESLSSIGKGNVAVSGMAPYRVTFGGFLANRAQPMIAIDGAGLLATPGSTPTTAGGTGALFVDDHSDGFTVAGPNWGNWTGDDGMWERSNHSLSPLSGLGTHHCEWKATGLSSGCYRVEMHHSTNFDHEPAAVFRIYDGDTFRVAVTVDLTQSPAQVIGYRDSLGHTINFAPLGPPVYIGSGTLRVAWHDDDVNPDHPATHTELDAIRVSPAPGSALPDVPVVARVDHAFVGGPPTIAVDGGAPFSLSEVIWSDGSTGPRLPYCVFPLPAMIHPNDMVTFTASAGWAVTDAGPLPSSSGLAVTNSSGVPPFPQVPPDATTLRVGWNTQLPDYPSPVMYLTNLMKGAGDWGSSTAVDKDGNYNGTDPNEQHSLIVVSTGGGPVTNPAGYASLPPQPGQAPADYTIFWDGAGEMWLTSSESCVEQVERRNLTGTTDNKKVFRISAPDGTSRVAPELGCRVRGATTNVRIYPPGVATDGSQHFHPEYLRMLAGAKVLRAMAPLQAGVANIRDYSDYMPTTQRSYSNAPERNVTLQIATVSGFDDTTYCGPYYDHEHLLLITTTTPHGLVTGEGVEFRGPGGGPMMIDVDTDGGPSRFDLNTWSWGMAYDPTRMSPSQFAFFVPNPLNNGANPRVSSNYTGGGTIHIRHSNGLPPEEHVDLCNAVGADCWINVEQTATDACVTQLARMIATRLKPGLKVAVELSNEYWNGGFRQASHFEGMARVLKLPNSSHAFADQTAHVHALFEAVLTPSGRPDDLIRVYGSFINGDGNTRDIATHCSSIGAKIDWVAVAPYYGNGPWNPQGISPAALDALTIDQIMDLGEAWIEYGGGSDAQKLAGHYAHLKEAGYPDAKLYAYECGPGQGDIGGSTDAVRAFQAQGWHNHPRQRGIALRDLAKLQEAGLVGGNFYTVAGQNNGRDTYCAYIGWDQPEGLGDGSDGKSDNRTNLHDVTRLVSVVGGAVKDWNARLSGTTPTPTPTPTPPTPVPVLRGPSIVRKYRHIGSIRKR